MLGKIPKPFLSLQNSDLYQILFKAAYTDLIMIPFLPAPKLLIFTEASLVLLQSSQVLLEQGLLEADLPEQISQAYQQGESRLQAVLGSVDPLLRQRVRTLLRLSPPEMISALVQDLTDQGAGSDLEQFLEEVGPEESTLRFPKLLVYPEALRQLCLKTTFSTEDHDSLQDSIHELQEQLTQRAQHLDLDLNDLIQETEGWLKSQSLETLEVLIQSYLDEDEIEPDDSKTEVSVAGPILFMEVVDYLLAQTELELTLDQCIDLQTNRMTAETRYQAMDKLGRIEDVEQQKAWIQAWLAQQTPAEVWQQVDQLFSVIQE